MAKLSISQAWDETKAVLARDGKLIGTVALALFVLPGIVFDLSLPDAPVGQFPPMGPWVGAALVAVLISLVCQLAIIRLAMGPHITVGESIVHGARRLLPYVAAFLLWVLPLLIAIGALYGSIEANGEDASPAAALAVIFLALVGIYLGVRLMLMPAVASTESTSPITIMRRSWEMSSGNWWRLFGFLLMFAVGAVALLWAIGTIVGLLSQLAFGSIERMSAGGLLVIIVSQVVSALISMVFFVMLARLFTQSAKAAQSSVPSSGT